MADFLMAKAPFGASTRMRSLAAAIALSEGWRRRAIALAAGATGAFALAPFDFSPALVIPMTVAVWLIDGTAQDGPWSGSRRAGLASSLWRAFATGWWWGFGYFLAGLWWLGAAFLVDADEFAWALPLGVIGLPAAMAFYPGFGFALARLLWSPGAGRIFALAVGLGLSEWLRGHLLTGFPWNSFGMALGGHLVTAQFASLVGLYGLTLAAILIAAAPAVLGGQLAGKWVAEDFASETRFFRREARHWAPLFGALAALAGLCGFGAFRLAQPELGAVFGARLRIMQPNLAQDEKFRADNEAAIMAHYLDLSARPFKSDLDEPPIVTVFIWPESAFPFILSRNAQALGAIGAFLRQDEFLVTGAARAEEQWPQKEITLDPPSPAPGKIKFFNAIQVIAPGGFIIDSYDKTHLVPFGEYLPLERFLARLGLHHFVHVPGGFEAGSVRKSLSVPGLPEAAPLICYEAIFPGEVTPPEKGNRPGFLLNVTNDGWFGMTAGPYQHFAQARLRAIEEGLPLVRAANSGISAVIDPYGRIKGQLPLGVQGVLDGQLPQRMSATFFARNKSMGAFSIWCVALIGAVALRIKKLTNHDK